MYSYKQIILSFGKIIVIFIFILKIILSNYLPANIKNIKDANFENVIRGNNKGNNYNEKSKFCNDVIRE